MEKTIITQFLKLLNVKCTSKYSDELFLTHPYRYSLYGLSKILLVYQIPNAGISVKDKEISEITPPFIAHIKHDFVIVKSVSKQDVTYEWRGRELTVGNEKFKKIWSGIALVVEPNESSIEPDYSKHLQLEWSRKIKKFLLWGMLLSTLFISCMNLLQDSNKDFIFPISINIIGVAICYLLWMKQEKLNSTYANKICSLFHQKDCNNVLESPGAKIAGFSWSQIGLGYFISNLLLILVFPNLINFLAIINIVILPYTIWSIWYQYKIVKQWCVLCLMVQVVLWVLFVTNYLLGYILIPSIEGVNMLAVVIIYACPILFINILSDNVNRGSQIVAIKQEFNSLKGKDEVFTALLKKEPCYIIDNKSASQIIFGNPSSNIKITILSNPHCKPCAHMHKRVADILKETKNEFCLQYIFTAFTDELLDSNRFLIAVYQQKSIEEAEQIFEYWFERGQYKSKEYIQKFNLQLDSPLIEIETQKHKQWKENSQLIGTPTILFNGYKLPEMYRIEDVVNFSAIDFE